jgi:hypothetical protein
VTLPIVVLSLIVMWPYPLYHSSPRASEKQCVDHFIYLTYWFCHIIIYQSEICYDFNGIEHVELTQTNVIYPKGCFWLVLVSIHHLICIKIKELICSTEQVIREGDIYFWKSHWEVQICIVEFFDMPTASRHCGVVRWRV